MTNFLADLAARNFDHAEVIRPRLPSLFEPWLGEADVPTPNPVAVTETPLFGSEGLESSQHSSLDFGVEQNASPVTKPVSNPSFKNNGDITDNQLPNFRAVKLSQASTNRERKDNFAESVESVNHDNPNESNRANNPRTLKEKTTVQPPSATTNRQEQVLPVAKPRPQDLASKRETSTHKEELNQLAKNETEYRDAFLSVITTKVVKQQNPSQQLTLVRTNPVSHENGVTLNLKTRKHLSSSATQNRPAIAAVDSENNFAKRETVAESQPTINVTIGRIEVRAAPAPAQHSKPKTTTNTMSLDDYLRQRSGGSKS